jgi:hypothetical protein
MGVATLLVAGLALWRFFPGVDGPGSEPGSAYRSKGAGMEILLHGGGMEADPGGRVEAGPGDTVSFQYRNDARRYVQIWFREDDGELKPFQAGVAGGMAWEPATRWTPSPQRILLDGRWNRQEIWIVAGDRPLSSEEALAAIKDRGGRRPGIGTWSFLVRRPGAPAESRP